MSPLGDMRSGSRLQVDGRGRPLPWRLDPHPRTDVRWYELKDASGKVLQTVPESARPVMEALLGRVNLGAGVRPFVPESEIGNAHMVEHNELLRRAEYQLGRVARAASGALHEGSYLRIIRILWRLVEALTRVADGAEREAKEQGE